MNNQEANVKMKQLSFKIIRCVDAYMENNDGDEMAAKLAVVMSVVTRVLATIAVTVEMPDTLAQEALKLEMEIVRDAIAEGEVKH
jgi:hypothetical protein